MTDDKAERKATTTTGDDDDDNNQIPTRTEDEGGRTTDADRTEARAAKEGSEGERKEEGKRRGMQVAMQMLWLTVKLIHYCQYSSYDDNDRRRRLALEKYDLTSSAVKPFVISTTSS